MSRTVDIKVPSNWNPPDFFSAASPDEVALALDTAAKLIPWVNQVKHEHEDAQQASRQRGVAETIEAALAVMQNADVERATQLKHDAEMALYEVRTQLEESKFRVVELTQALKASEQRIADAEARGRATGLLECDARLERELSNAETRRSTLESELRARMAEALRDRDALRAQCEASSAKIVELEATKRQLETPSGRGSAGEADVAKVVASLGYEVVDTSKFKDKDKYGDILCVGTVEGVGGSASCEPPRIRLAIEVKNRVKLSQADVAAFEAKVRRGVAAGLFEGGLFVSQRCSVPCVSGAAAQAMLKGADGKPTIPMAYVGADRNGSSPVLTEHVEVVVQAQMYLCEQAAHVRTALMESDIDDDDMRRVQAHFGELVTYTTEMFAAFAKHQDILDAARKSLDVMKTSTLVAYRTARRLNASVPWLQRSMAQISCEKGIDHAVRLASEGKLHWSNVSHKDSLMQTLGKECATSVVYEEMRRLGKEADQYATLKRKRDDDASDVAPESTEA